jgi:hypothetical protein
MRHDASALVDRIGTRRRFHSDPSPCRYPRAAACLSLVNRHIILGLTFSLSRTALAPNLWHDDDRPDISLQHYCPSSRERLPTVMDLSSPKAPYFIGAAVVLITYFVLNNFLHRRTLLPYPPGPPPSPIIGNLVSTTIHKCRYTY